MTGRSGPQASRLTSLMVDSRLYFTCEVVPSVAGGFQALFRRGSLSHTTRPAVVTRGHQEFRFGFLPGARGKRGLSYQNSLICNECDIRYLFWCSSKSTSSRSSCSQPRTARGRPSAGLSSHMVYSNRNAKNFVDAKYNATPCCRRNPPLGRYGASVCLNFKPKALGLWSPALARGEKNKLHLTTFVQVSSACKEYTHIMFQQVAVESQADISATRTAKGTHVSP